MKLNELTIKQAHEGLVAKKFTSVDLTKACLAEIKKSNKKLNAFITVTEKEALEQAKAVDKKISAGKEIGILEGVPMALKDNILVKDIRATSGSKILENYVASYDATAVEKLRIAGAVILGKTNLDEFAMGASTETSYFGPTKNPHDTARVPGGSSGGSAAAVAANMCIYALGSDTGGSVRQPASFCGVTGLKPTYGAVSRYGLMAMASSLDQIGPITKTAEDAEIVFETIRGKDEMDSTTVENKNKKGKIDIKKLKIGIPKEYFVSGMDPKVEKCVRDTVDKLKKMGAKIVDVSLPHAEYTLAVYYLIVPAEVSANLARYDGVRYGYQTKKSKTLLETYLKTRAEGLGDEVKRRIMLGTYTLSAGYYDAYYLQAQKMRTLIREDFENVFKEVDCLVMPTAPTTAFKIGEKIDDPLTMYLSDVFTVSANIAGLPAISVPCGEVKKMPVGLQIMGKWFDEKTILELAKLI
ncbi:MAG: Asp-tRNA(Asn)/Glu-tRNA(Gln) amidotransferase subunit GatA [Patescibacteria group bacterium]|jgi:aspartyl-tRNA(Asn)/glutamyl-tRNA(Gln) amidotransferase subunit A